jgi:DNA-binding NtrC family response regulator
LANRKGLIAVVDDELDITLLFRDVLQTTNGVSIFAFTDPKAALEHFAINREDYTLIISDLRMPSINGMELIKKVKELNPYIRTILMTAFALDDNNLFQVELEAVNKNSLTAQEYAPGLDKDLRENQVEDLVAFVNSGKHQY